MKIYINDFVEDLNYRKVILDISNVELLDLRLKLEKDRMNHMSRFDSVLENDLMFVDNCDLLDVDTDHGDEFGNSLLYLIRDGYVVYSLKCDPHSKRYFVETNLNTGFEH